MEEQTVDEKILYVSPAVQALITENSNSEAARLLAALTDKNGYKVQDYVDDPERQWQPGYVGCISVGMRGEAIEISEPSKIAPVLRHILANVDLESAMKIQKKTLAISRAVRDLIESTPAAALLERLKKEQGYEVQDVVEYGTEKPGVIGHIVTTNTETATDYVINSAEGIILVLSKILSPEKSNAAEHSPPASFALSYQDGGRQLMRESDDGKSIDVEELGDGKGVVELRGFRPEPKSFFAKWCSCFPCFREPDQEPLLSSAPPPKVSLK